PGRRPGGRRDREPDRGSGAGQAEEPRRGRRTGRGGERVMLRATLKSLLSRKLRLVLSAMSVVLAVMFVSGAFVLSDTLGRTFDSLFTSVYDYVDIQLEAKPKLAENGDVAALAAPIPAATVGQVEGVPGVRKATGQVFADGVRVIGNNGKVISAGTAPRFGANWTGEAG